MRKCNLWLDAAVLTLIATVASGQEWERDWSRIWGSPMGDYGYAVAAHTNGDFYVAGFTWDAFDGQTNQGVCNAFLTRYTAAGAKAWSRIWGAPDTTYAYAVAVDSTGAVYVAGQTQSGFDGQQAVGQADLFLSKFSVAGQREWTRIWGSVLEDGACGVAADTAGGVYVCGYCSSNFDGQASVGQRDVFFSKFQADGTRAYSRIWGSPLEDCGQGIGVDPQGGVYVAGYAYAAFDQEPFSGTMDAFLTRHGAGGTREWTRMWGSSGQDQAMGVAVDTAGRVYVAGYGGPFGDQPKVGEPDPFLCRYDHQGTCRWARIWGSPAADSGLGVAVAGTNAVYVTGMAGGADFDGQTNVEASIFVTAFDAAGTNRWSRRWGALNASGQGVAALIDAGGRPQALCVAGFTSGGFDGQTNTGQVDAFLSHWGPQACLRFTDGPRATNIAATQATIRWQTDRPGDSEVRYGVKAFDYTWTASDSQWTTNHAVPLTNLTASTTYHFISISRANAGCAATSSPAYFTTAAGGGGAPTATNLTLDGGFAFPMDLALETSGEVERVMYYFDGRHIFTSFSPPFNGELDPRMLDLDMAALRGRHQVRAVIYGADGSVRECVTDLDYLDDCGSTMDVEFVYPEHGLTVYTTGTVAQASNVCVTVFARERLTPPERDKSFDGLGPRDPFPGLVRYGPVARIDFEVDGVPTGQIAGRDPEDPYTWHRWYNLRDLALGRHRLTARAYTSNDCVWSDVVYVNVENFNAQILALRSVYRMTNYFLVQWQLRNRGDGPAVLRSFREEMTGFQPTRLASPWPSTTNYSFSLETQRNSVALAFPETATLAAGATGIISYCVVPYLTMGPATYGIGGAGGQIVYHALGGSNVTLACSNEARWVTRPGSVVPWALSDAVRGAIATSDYILVTNPLNLLGFYGNNANDVMAKMAELATRRLGVLGYFYYNQPLPTVYAPGNLFATGDTLNDWRDELVVGDMDEGWVRVYDSSVEVIISSNIVPFAFDLQPGDALLTGDLHQQVHTNNGFFDQIIIVQGPAHGAEAGRACAYRYDYLSGGNVIGYLNTSYGTNSAVAVGRIMTDNGGYMKDQVIVARPTGRLELFSAYGLSDDSFDDTYFRAGDTLLAARLWSDANDQAVVASRAFDMIQVIAYRAGSLASVVTQACALASNDIVTVGDVWGDNCDEIVVVRPDRRNCTFYGYSAGRLRELRTFDFTLAPGDQLACGRMYYSSKDLLVILHGLAAAGTPAGTVTLSHYPSSDNGGAATLDDLLDSGGAWARQLAPTWSSSGYLLIVGETEIIPTFSTSWDLWYTARGKVDYTDRNYASTTADENNSPELGMGRIIGNYTANINAPLDAALAVIDNPARLCASNSIALAGYERAPNGLSDYISFWSEAMRGQAELMANGFTGAVRYTPDYNKLALLEAQNSKHAILWFGHGNWDLWDYFSQIDIAAHAEWRSHRPVIYASSCLTGRYPTGRGIAEACLRAGAAAYIGSTEVTLGGFSEYLAYDFANRLDLLRSVGHALRDAKNTRLGSSSRYSYQIQNRYHSASAHYFGDPKLALQGAHARRAAAGGERRGSPLAPRTGPVSTLDIQVPFYIVDTTNNLDYVTIPGQDNICEPGQPMVPMYTESILFPAGCVVQGVTLTRRDGATASQGLRLPVYELALVDQRGDPALRAPQAPAATWWPEGDLDWALTPQSDGGTRLDLTLYPFYYDSNTLAAVFYTNYSVAIASAASDVTVNRILTDFDSYQVGDTVNFIVYVHGTNAQPRDVILAAQVVSNNLYAAETLPLRTLRGVQGYGECRLAWDTAGFPGGDYALEVELLTDQNVVLDRRTLEFRVGRVEGQTLATSLAPAQFRRGENVTLAAAFSNSGDSAVSGTIVIQAQDAAGALVADFRCDFSNLTAGAVAGFSTVWTNMPLVPRDCQVIAFTLYEGRSTDTVTAYRWDEAPLLLDDVVVAGSNVVLRWPSVAGRTYGVEIGTSLPAFAGFTNVPAAAPQNCYTDAPPEPVLFYRVREYP